MAYPQPRLGIVPVVAVALIKDAPAILADIEGLFVGSSYDATHQQILTWATTIVNDPTLATFAAQDAWLRLRCWAGDQTVITAADTAELFGGGNTAQGCGCEVAHGCRADAQQAVATLKRNVPALTTGALSTSPYTTPYGTPAPAPSSGGSGTIYTGLPGGVQVGLPVPASAITGSELYGVPLTVWLAGGLVLAFALGQKGRH